MAKQYCGTCKHWDRASALGPSGKRLKKEAFVLCQWRTSDPVPKHPDACKPGWGVNARTFTDAWLVLMRPGYMEANSGQACECWEER